MNTIDVAEAIEEPITRDTHTEIKSESVAEMISQDEDAPTTYSTIERILDAMDRSIETGESVIESMSDRATANRRARKFTCKAAAEMLGVTENGIRYAELNIDNFPKAEVDPKTQKRAGYSLKQINDMRAYFGVPHEGRRIDKDQPFVVSAYNFKGGCGKTTINVGFAQYCALKGLKVLFLDMDGQGTATDQFGFSSRQIAEGETILPFLDNRETDLEYAIRETSWDGIDIIPAGMHTSATEFIFIKQMNETSYTNVEEDYDAEVTDEEIAKARQLAWANKLREGIDTVSDNYDIVVIDPPPSLGMMSINIFKALDGVVLPIIPSMFDFHSTLTFMRMINDVLGGLYENNSQTCLQFMRVLVSKYQKSSTSDKELAKLIQHAFDESILMKHPILASAEVTNAGAEHETVYDSSKPRTNRATYNRCMDSMNAVFDETLSEIQKCWPGHQSELAKEDPWN